jgi:hypothetical protein
MTKGTYGGGTFGVPFFGGFGGGLYIDNHGRVYPQLYGGTPGGSLSAGYSSDLEGLLMGPSISWSPGVGSVRFNVGTSQSASGFGIGTPGGGVTHGFGPLEMSHDFSRPWATPYLRDSAAAAEIPSRYNVWEYDYPESASPNASSASASVAKTYTPQQIADLLVRYGHVRPATRSQEELSPFERRLQSGLATVGQPSEWPIRFLSSRRQDPLGGSMAGWTGNLPGDNMAATAAGINAPNQNTRGTNVNQSPEATFTTGAAPVPFLPAAAQSKPGGLPGLIASVLGSDSPNPMQFQPPVGGLLGLIQEYMRDQAVQSGSR